MPSVMDDASLDQVKLATDLSSSSRSFPDTFVWDWYIRLRVQFPVHPEVEISSIINDLSQEFDGLWTGNSSKDDVPEN
jgi:hypothetical protein